MLLYGWFNEQMEFNNINECGHYQFVKENADFFGIHEELMRAANRQGFGSYEMAYHFGAIKVATYDDTMYFDIPKIYAQDSTRLQKLKDLAEKHGKTHEFTFRTDYVNIEQLMAGKIPSP